MQEGNNQVVLCERGIRTFENYTRNTPDLAGVAAVSYTHLDVYKRQGLYRFWRGISPEIYTRIS